jgi:hypothetical protein
MARRNIDRTRLSVEDRDILDHCAAHPLSIAEIAAGLDLPLTVAKVLVSDLLARDLLIAGEPDRPDRQLLEAVLNGVRKL